MQLNPRESFTIVRQIEDHTDASTYYVRAVIRNAKTDALLATVNLTDRGSRRFSYAYQVPTDPSGQGFFISILTSVYTDSGYTTKSENYGDKMDVYLVQDRAPFNPNYPVPTGGGSDIDYKRVAKIVDESVASHFKALKIPEQKDVKIPDVSGPLASLKNDVLAAIRSISIPTPKDYTSAFDDIKASMAELEKSLSGGNNALSDVVTSHLKALEKEIADYETKSLSMPKEILSKLDALSAEVKAIEVNVPEMSLQLVPKTAGKPSEPTDRVKKLTQK